MAPNKKTAASRAAASKGKARVPSASKGGLGVGPAAGKRKRSVDSHSNSSDRDSDGGEPLPRTTIKKCKVSPGNASESMDSAHALGDSSSANADGPMDLDHPANHAIGERRKHKKSGIMAIDTSLKPISDVREMFEDMVFRIDPVALKESPIKLNVATLCSGTDAPIFALELIQDALQAMGYGAGFEFNHLFSCEIEPYKQGFIRRNLPHDTTIFRDVVELASAVSTGQATTAAGSKAAIPTDQLDILFAGCSCVDYSHMNQNKPSGRVPSLDRHLKQKPKKKRRGRKKGPDVHDQEAPVPVKIDEAFVKDLDPGLEELLLLPSGGESSRTFFAAIKLITARRPKLIILENVSGAPWDMYTEQIFPKIGYVAHHIRVDSKEFYLPQTRQRGYLVAIDATRWCVEQASQIATESEVQLSRCKRPPSVPISAFLRPADDPATIQARADMESKSSCSPPEWALCALRHADARQKNGLRRDDNRFSEKAMRNGRLIFAIFPSHSWIPFWGCQVARIVDLVDIAFGVSYQQGVDLGYKTGMIDVSQNVDRNSFVLAAQARSKRNLGIVGCITPSGLPIVTDLMRPITGFETLSLQGLPVDELVLSTETQGQLRDLAGNAMTVTVVGAVTLALLLAVYKVNPELLNRIDSAQPRRGLYLEAPQDEALIAGRSSGVTFELKPLLAIAEKMARVCYCFSPSNEVFVCNACGITACSACRGSPEHHFGAQKVADFGSSAENGKVRLQNLLPSALTLPVPHSVVYHGMSLAKEALYCSVVSDILTADPVYYFDDIKVTEDVAVCYKATNSIARLVLSPGSTCCWYIYIAPWHPARTQLASVFDLSHPVARGQFPSSDASVPQWSVWALGHINLALELVESAHGALVASNLSFVDSHGVELDASLQAWKEFVEAKVCGSYLHRPKCGTAGKALRAKQASASAEKVFMMWESAPLRDSADDHFVWTGDVRRMEPHEYREIWLRANATLPWKLDSGLGSVSVFWPGYWSSPAHMSEFTRPGLFQDLVHLRWGPTQSIQHAGCHIAGRSPITSMPVFVAMTATFRDFPVSPARVSKFDASRTENNFAVIPSNGADAFLRLFSFLSAAICASRAPADHALFTHLDGNWIPITSCRDCSVTPPEIAVYLKKDEKNSTRAIPKFTKVILEDPDEAALFERQYQDLPRAVAVAARLLQGCQGESTVDVRVMLQPKTLASRALGYLLQAHRTASRGRLALVSDAKTSFTVMLDYAPSSASGFAPFHHSIQPCGAKFLAGIDLTRKPALPNPVPPRFVRLSGKGTKMKMVEHKLRSSQQEAVKWMLQREHTPLDFVKSEIEEEVVAPLNLRVAGKAEWTNHFPYSSRGGVVAHEIGYGKTVVSLALIDCMRYFDQEASIKERKEKVDAALLEEHLRTFEELGGLDLDHPKLRAETFFCHLPATLVIVPRHITDQWAKEAEKFLGVSKPKLLIIKTAKAFYDQYPLKKLQEAEIIIVSSAVFTEGFKTRLQTVAGRGPEYPAGLSGRTLEAWYCGALRNHRILTAYYFASIAASIPEDDILKTIREVLLPGLVGKQQAEIDALVDKQVSEIDRSLYKKHRPKVGLSKSASGSKNQEDNAGSDSKENDADSDSKQNDKQNDANIESKENSPVTESRESSPGTGSKESSPGTGSKKHKGGKQRNDSRQTASKNPRSAAKTGDGVWNISWLHTCSFARIIWDECSYDDEETISLFIANAVANAKWLLSGTPKLFGLDQVCKTAAAFGIHVARPEPRIMPGLPAVTKGPELNPMSKSEAFHVFSSRVKSSTLAHERHSHAEGFVAAFFRANALDAEIDIRFVEQVRPVNMTASDSVRYHLLSQEVLDAGYDYSALPAHSRGEVRLRGSDLMDRDVCTQAKMLLGLLACGLGEDKGSTMVLRENLARRSDVLSDQMKLLWDKAMWLWRWIIELKPENDAKIGMSQAVQDTLKRVDTLCNSFGRALLGDGDFEDFGGKDMFQHEAAVVAGVQDRPHDTRPDLESLRAKWATHFQQGWEMQYSKNNALYTWLDFFEAEKSVVTRLSEKQLRLLVEDIFWLGYKVGLRAQALKDGLPKLECLRDALIRCNKTATRSVPVDMDDLVAEGRLVLDGLDEEELTVLVCACIDMNSDIKQWQDTKKDDGKANLNLDGRKGVKAALQERLTEVNLKYTPGQSIEKLKALLWQHDNGVSVCENYRDGRAPPDKHRDLDSATWCGGETAKQMEATNEELKRTMVHLAKTIEDLRATRLEANFVPEYSSLATAQDGDSIVKTKLCGGCRQPLKSACSSFLVVACGHFLCGDCRFATGFYCPVKDCPAFIRKRPVLRCSQVLRTAVDEPRTKAESVADLIKNEIPPDDYVVVFAQYGTLINALDGAFKEANLECLNLAAMKDDVISKELEKFKAGMAGKVLLLDMDSETSAGSNLTIARHVIFANPYLHQDKEHQARTVRQARGRCIRTGQTETVHVYHFMVSGTIEEETLRKFGEESPAVQEHFEKSNRLPWWLDEVRGDNDIAMSEQV
ncbi:hypothetical protein NEMBOFW57_008693 [Staphylotrichum longicolle]|uniref:Helicase ATP-binding domain-containing protein n=1 Tax=Staphylotrichum longicolle TaxID=669026 RepID=A0AAD4HU78_9PEZI|nr:hypothetical protein NEMBOFW57_008693 [Staphylotrichum longicolle]